MQYTHEQLEIQKTLKRFIDDEINPNVDVWEDAEAFPAHEVFKKLGNLGLLGLTKPEAHGGAGLDYSYGMAMAEALGHIDCGAIPMAIGVQTDMCTPALARKIKKIGMNASDTGLLYFDEVRVPQRNRIGAEGQGSIGGRADEVMKGIIAKTMGVAKRPARA